MSQTDKPSKMVIINHAVQKRDGALRRLKHWTNKYMKQRMKEVKYFKKREPLDKIIRECGNLALWLSWNEYENLPPYMRDIYDELEKELINEND